MRTPTMDVHQEMAADGENFGSLDADGGNFGSLDPDEPELVSPNENEAASDEAFLTHLWIFFKT
jgi:hypothetical protein